MASIGLAHREHRGFVAEWHEPDSRVEVEGGLVDAVGRSLTAAGVDGAARPRRLATTEVSSRDEAAAEAWLLGEPTF